MSGSRTDLGGEFGGGYWVPGWALAAMHGPRSPLHDWRRQARGRDRDLYDLLRALCLAAQHHVAGGGQISTPPPATDQPWECLTTTQAADRLGISPRTLRRLIGEGHLRADWISYGWLISAEEVERYRAQRAAA